MTSRQLKMFRRKLAEQLTAMFHGVHEQVREAMVQQMFDGEQPRDEGDESLLVQLRDARMSLAENEARRAQEIEAALARMDAGTFGICVECGEPIELERLKAVPWAARCIDDQTAAERDLHPPRL